MGRAPVDWKERSCLRDCVSRPAAGVFFSWFVLAITLLHQFIGVSLYTCALFSCPACNSVGLQRAAIRSLFLIAPSALQMLSSLLCFPSCLSSLHLLCGLYVQPKGSSRRENYEPATNLHHRIVYRTAAQCHTSFSSFSAFFFSILASCSFSSFS